jgi:hypothetical protein
MSAQPLVLTGPEGLGIKEKIRQGKTQQILQDATLQQNSATWSQ